MISGLGGSSLLAYIIGFGVFTGSGVGFGYAATTPASIKWFPPQRTGLIAGIVVAGFGLAPVVLAPLSAWFLDLFASTNAQGVVEQGVSETMIALGIITWVVVGGLALFVRNPPEGHLVQPPAGGGAARIVRPEFSWRQMLRTTQFWLLFVMFFFGAAAGLTFISVASDLGKHALGAKRSSWSSCWRVGNSTGRILTGTLSDRIGRQWTLLVEFIWQALVVAALYKLSSGDASWAPILAVVFMLGFNYGTNLAVFPAACKDYFGIRNFGLNYGCLFAAFGSAGLIMPWVNGLIEDKTGSLRPLLRDHHRPAGRRRRAGRREQGRGATGSASRRSSRRGRRDGVMAIVTISRGSFSGGVAVAEAVAARLGVPCISREVVRDAAQASGVDEGSLLATLEDPPRFWEKTPGRIPAHLNLVRTALLQRADGRDFVYHGYAGHLLLSGISHVLRVRVIASEAYRVETAMHDRGLNEKEATRYVKKLNVQLRKWTEFLYGVDWQDPSLYDVVLRVDRVGVEGAADTIVRMTGLPRVPADRRVAQGAGRPAAQQHSLVGVERRREDAHGERAGRG